MRFHLKDESPFALADVNVERLKFVNRHATFSDKQALLVETFKTESEHFKAHEVSGLYAFEIANLLYMQSKAYKPVSNEAPRWKAKEALEICETILAKFPKSKGAFKCENLKQNILSETCPRL